jgi:hypothetical protein
MKATKLNEVTLEDLAHDIRNASGEATIATANVDDEKHLLARLKTASDAARVTVKEPRAGGKRRRTGL